MFNIRKYVPTIARLFGASRVGNNVREVPHNPPPSPAHHTEGPKKEKIHKINPRCGEDINPLITCRGNGRMHRHRGGIYRGQIR